jgi:secretion/DNA translocation related TadE-like protein
MTDQPADGGQRQAKIPGQARDRGGATIWLLAAGLLVVLFGAAIAGVGSAIVARHRAQAAADLGALAGAPHALAGEPVVCGWAARVVAANGARLVECRLDGVDVIVTTAVTPAGYAGLAGAAQASARAGPADAPAPARAPARPTPLRPPAAPARPRSPAEVTSMTGR